MTHTTAAPSAPSTTDSSSTTAWRGLRTLHLVRAAFSVVWVAVLLTTSMDLVGADEPTLIAGILLVLYPAWDVAATFLERRLAGAGSASRVGVFNIALGVAAAVAMTVAVLTTIGSAFLVFGAWALLSGAAQLTVAVRRRHEVGAQWPMIISGALSVLAGGSIAAMTTSDTSGLGTMAGYSAVGAFWFIVSAVALTVRGRRATR